MNKVNVVAAIITRDNRFLVGKRALNKKSSPGYWSPIGGRVETNESESDAVIRECSEELGIKVLPIRKITDFDVNDGSAHLHWWQVQVLEGEPQILNDEHTELKWVTLEEMRALRPIQPEDLAAFENFIVASQKIKTVKKVLIYTLRKREQLEVLVFDHVKYPEVSPQLPAGTVEKDEDILEAAKRELFEESGVQTTQELKFIGNYLFYKELTNQYHDRHIFVVNGDHISDGWIHTVTGKGEDEHLEFKYYWLPVSIAQERLQANLGDGFKMFGVKIRLPSSRGK
jgi:8-oxo-dGTP pyrophosphatase MutT (NUDIX family)